MKRSIKSSRQRKSSNLLRRSGIGVIFIAVGLASVFLVYSVVHEHRERGQLNITDTYIGENLSHSLDLKLAAKANYSSDPIVVTQDLGVRPDKIHQQIFSFKVKTDDLTEYGLLSTPLGSPPKQGWPTIILLHGYSNPSRYSTMTGYISDTQFYAQHGFAVLKPDYRGEGLSKNQGKSDSAYYSMAYNTDVMSLISAAKQTSFVDPNNINLWGHSMGAYIALRAAVLSHDIKNVILLSGPVDSLSEMYLTYIPPSDENNARALATRNEVFSKYHTPSDNSRFWYDASPSNFLNQITADVQIHVGQKDEVVPPKFSADLSKALTKNNIKHQYYSYNEGDHSLSSQRNQIWQRTLQDLGNS